jgi:beta-lactamase regulating signal transducer with metallopeptidase domain
MLVHLADVSIRSLLLALPAAIVLWILRSRRTAALQHAVWVLVVCGMLALFAFGQALPRLPLRILESPTTSVPAIPPAGFANAPLLEEALQTKPLPPPIAAKTARSIDWMGVVMYGYGAIAFAFLGQFVTGMFLIRKLLATAHYIPSVGANSVYESERIAVPLTVGWLRPRVLLPLEWREWDRNKLDAVLAHEGAHVRRRDGLIAALAAVNRCVFWFHPLAWMLERKLALLAEQACDEYCVAAMGDRQRYAHLLLEMALVVDGSQGRLRRHALTMAAASYIRQRIDSLLQEGRTFSRGLTWTGWAAVTLCGIPLVFGAGAVELNRQPPLLSLELPRWSVPAPPVLERKLSEKKPVLLAQKQAAPAPVQAPTPQSTASAKTKFDVASIKPCVLVSGGGPGGPGGRGASGGGGRVGWDTAPGRVNIWCLSVAEILKQAYVSNGNDPPINWPGSDTQLVRGGETWVYSSSYTIEAETDDPMANGPAVGSTPAARMMMGPMLQALLEDRFQLKIHREVEEASMYALTVAKGGLKLNPWKRVVALREDISCVLHRARNPRAIPPSPESTERTGRWTQVGPVFVCSP